MIQLEKDGVVDGIISEDGDEVALGARLLLTEFTRKTNGEHKFNAFSAEKFFCATNPYQSKICKHKNLIKHAALLLRKDYCTRIKGRDQPPFLGVNQNYSYKRNNAIPTGYLICLPTPPTK